MKKTGLFTQNKEIKTISVYLARIHNKPLLDLRNATFLSGQYLHEKSLMVNIPFHKEIQKALEKMDAIMHTVTGTVAMPFVNLWNGTGENKDHLRSNFYGNPAWDLGIVTNMLGNSVQIEEFLQQYLDNQGVLVTIIELYTGILYAKINEAMDNRYKSEWQRLAANECANIINGTELAFEEIPAEMLARLGLPGLSRVE